MFKITTLNHINNDTNRPLISLTTRLGNKYLFGKIPEGCQRILNSINSEIKYNKLQGIFLTGNILGWSDLGGLPGLFLTISDATKQGIKIYGNSKILSYIVTTWRQFVFRLGINIDIIDVIDNKEIILSNDEVTVKSITIESNKNIETETNKEEENILLRQIKKLASLMFPLNTSEINSRNPESYKSDPSQRDIHTHVKLPRSKISQYLNFQNQSSISYLLEFSKIRGKFDPKRAIELGIKPGPQFRDLTNGHSVANEKGEIIEPSQVLGPDKILPNILIIDIPTDDFYENTISSNIWFKIENLGLVYHFIGDDINFNLDSYIENFISKFPSSIKHVISHKSISENVIINDKFVFNHLKLKTVMNENFNVLNSEDFSSLILKENIDKLHSLQAFGISEKGIISNNSQVTNKSIEDIYNNEVKNSNENTPSFTDLEKSNFLLENDIDSENLKDFVHICTLGTGSALPSIQRNVLSTLLRIPYQSESGDITYRSILLDGGENTIGSLLRNFGQNNQQDFIKIFKELKLIYISHLHADHHLGICSIINKWFEINTNEEDILYMILPWQFITFLKDWYNLESNHNTTFDIYRLKMFSCEDFIQIESRQPEYIKISLGKFEELFDSGKIKNEIISKSSLTDINLKEVNKMYDAIGLKSIASVRALHCSWAYSTTFEFKLNQNQTQFFKVSFSGDTRPNLKFIKIGNESDLLIHESSLDTYWIDEAIAKKHTTMIEAIWVSKFMKCSNLILTHFSTRYGIGNNYVPKQDLINESKKLKASFGGDNEKNKRLFNILKNINLDEIENSEIFFENLNIVYAYDLMNFKFRNMNFQELVQPQIQNLFEINLKKRKLDDNDIDMNND
ncbi:uncharacterized protein KGF55_000037 [Candida pseudojiufengensis]|uniref:uncharacterized protein n=1 Tax=Candida pseudojiufengensis TaxID=497109 RepID=UPI002224D4A3|nr:uncharacterized protein KGF55_000037 [Candida pseudojiufengensis]KAI5968053.1 hypothetical protein KGF55_000037 [Candida pseudojiufengensis]